MDMKDKIALVTAAANGSPLVVTAGQQVRRRGETDRASSDHGDGQCGRVGCGHGRLLGSSVRLT